MSKNQSCGTWWEAAITGLGTVLVFVGAPVSLSFRSTLGLLAVGLGILLLLIGFYYKEKRLKKQGH